jgi:hypothetical protein
VDCGDAILFSLYPALAHIRHGIFGTFTVMKDRPEIQTLACDFARVIKRQIHITPLSSRQP